MKNLIHTIIARYAEWRRLRQFKREFEELFMPDRIANREMTAFLLGLILAILVTIWLFAK